MSTKFVQTFLAEENISETMKTVAERVSATGATLTSTASALFDFGEEASNATKKVTPLQSTLANIDKTAGTVSDGVQSMNKELKSISGASDDAAKSLQKIADKGIPTSVYDKLMGWASGLHLVKEAAVRLQVPFRNAFELEDTGVRLAPLVGGLERSRELAEHLRREAANGTMEFSQLASVAGRLAGTFKSTENIKQWTTAFHNLAAGTGLDVNELVGNFVKAKASGRFEAGFMDMFAQKGVNIYEPLAKELKMSETEIRNLAATGALEFSKVEAAILACATGTGVFAGQAAAMSDTAGGSVGKLLAEWNILLSKLAEPIAESLTPLLQNITAAAVKLEPVFSGIGSALSIASDIAGVAFSHLPVTISAAAAATLLFNQRLRALMISDISAQIGSIPVALRAAKAATLGFAATFKTAMRSVKASMISTGIGAAVVAIGFAVEMMMEWFAEAGEAAEQFEEDLKSLKAEAEEMKNTYADAATSQESLELLRKKHKEEEAAWRERLDGFEENSDEYKQLFEAFTTWKQAAENADLNAQRQIDARKRAERIKSDAEELSAMRKHSENLRAEISKLKADATREAAESVHSKIQLELTFANVDSVEALDRELAGLSQLNELTAEQDARSKELLATKQKIDSLEKSAAAARASLREKVQLMQAELAGNDKLLALKEKLYRADLRSQFLKAGVSADKVEEQVQKYIELEKQLEAKRKRESADKATAADDAELDILKAKAAGDEKRAKQLERERKELEHIRKLEEQGVPAEEAKRRARERANAELSIEEQKLDSVAAKNERAAATFEVRTARGTETRTVQDVPAMRAVPAGTRTGNAGDAAGIGQTVGKSVGQTLVDINIAIRDNTRGILDVLRRGISPQKVLVNPVLS